MGSGDKGETSLFGGIRVAKDIARIEACGTIDELNCALGLARAEGLPGLIDNVLERLQHELFSVGAELATLDPLARGTRWIGQQHVSQLETDIQRCQAELPVLEQFVLPGGTRGAAALHLARAICRRAERRLVSLARHGNEQISPALLAYLNRLSDLLFVLARFANHQAGLPEAIWRTP